MRVLILSCNTGEGHNTAGKAMRERIEHQGHDVTMLDLMRLAGERTSKLVEGSYVGIVNHAPRLFQILYKAGDLISSSSRKSPVYYANALLGKNLGDYLDLNPYDVILTPHLFAAEALTELKSKGRLKQPVVAISTDYTCIPFWEETDCDYYILPHGDLTEEYVQKGLPREKLLACGIPVGLAFSSRQAKKDAQRTCGLPPGAPAYLVMGGSMGFGKMQEFVSQLAQKNKNGEQIIIICGNNVKRRQALQQQFSGHAGVHVLGYTRHVADYMDACDVVFTKPGGLTSTEAAVKNIPIVHTTPIPGCETINLAFFSSKGMSLAAKSIPEQIEAGHYLLSHPSARERMTEAQRKNINPHASLDIFHLLETL